MKHCSLKQTRSCKTIHFIPRALNNYLKAPSAKYESLPLSPVPYYFSSISAHQRFSFVLLQHPPYITPTYLLDSNPPVWMRTLFFKTRCHIKHRYKRTLQRHPNPRILLFSSQTQILALFDSNISVTPLFPLILVILSASFPMFLAL